MNQQLINKFPTWYKDITPDKYYMVLSNDYDSYYSCKLLRKLFGITIGGFYSLDSGLYLNRQRTENKEPIFIDLSVTKGKTFDNHFTFIKNPESINPNVIENVYYRKYNGSTLALLYSLYNIDLSQVNEDILTTLLCIDGWYIGYYNKGGRYRDINIYWYKMLDMDKYLLPILESHNAQYFTDFIKKHKLKTTITIQGNHLHCNAKIGLPKYEFELAQPVKRQNINKYKLKSIYSESSDEIITAAECYKNFYSICRKAV
ncbi:MAG: DUF5672 domain-containing protein [Oscillospiraceae bacterium]|jgi:hypothetical protein